MRYANPAERLERFVEDLTGHVAAVHYDALLPPCDYTTTGVALHRSAVASRVGVAVPPFEALEGTKDKWRLARMAGELGIATPKTHALATAEDTEALSRRIAYPCVVKPRPGFGRHRVPRRANT
jgi:carbamoylphosphate synthase large subunit